MKRCSKFIFLSVALMAFESTYEWSLSIGGVTVNIDWNQIYPKTKWCGSGTYPTDGSLGEDECTDACCKAHVECSLKIKPRETVNGLLNTYDYTASSCECEAVFRSCLLKNIQDSTNEDSSRGVGQIYFTALGMDCVKEDHPIIQCLSKTTFPERCNEYELNTNLPKIWQWFDVLAFDIE